MEHSHHFRIWFWLSFLSPLSLSKPFLSFSEHTASASLTVPLPLESPLLPFPVPFCSSFIRCNKKVPDMFTWSRHSSSQQLSMVLSCFWIMYKHLSQVPDTPLGLFPPCFPILFPTVYPHQKAPANFSAHETTPRGPVAHLSITQLPPLWSSLPSPVPL